MCEHAVLLLIHVQACGTVDMANVTTPDFAANVTIGSFRRNLVAGSSIAATLPPGASLAVVCVPKVANDFEFRRNGVPFTPSITNKCASFNVVDGEKYLMTLVSATQVNMFGIEIMAPTTTSTSSTSTTSTTTTTTTTTMATTLMTGFTLPVDVSSQTGENVATPSKLTKTTGPTTTTIHDDTESGSDTASETTLVDATSPLDDTKGGLALHWIIVIGVGGLCCLVLVAVMIAIAINRRRKRERNTMRKLDEVNAFEFDFVFDCFVVNRSRRRLHSQFSKEIHGISTVSMPTFDAQTPVNGQKATTNAPRESIYGNVDHLKPGFFFLFLFL